LRELERVRAGDLRGTPLLLTIAAKVYLEWGTLPERRSVLYGQFVEIWLSEAEQRGLNEQLGERLAAPVDLHLARLAHLALRLTERPDQADLEALAGFVAEHLQSQEGFTRLHAETYGRQFVQVMAQRSGVFTRRGDAFDFIHPTFREYLAACAVVRESRRDRGYDLKQVWRQAVSRWSDRDWREAALSALSLLSDGGQDVTALVSRVWREEGGLYFAGAALAEQVKVDESLSDGIINGLFTEARSGELWRVGALITLSKLRSYPRVGDRLLALARDEKVAERVRKNAAEALVRFGRAAEAVQAWLALACDEKVDEWMRERAAAALGELGRADEAAPILLAIARDEKVRALVRVDAAEALSELGRAGEAAPVLLALAHDEKVDEWVRVDATAALGELGRADETAQAWPTLARDERVGWRVHARAAEALGELGWGDEAAPILLALARDEEVDADVRVDATAAMAELGRADDLLALAHNEKVDAIVRLGAAAVLRKLGQADEAAPILVALACAEKVDEWVRARAADVLVELGRADDLLALAHNEKVDAWVRERAAAVLGELGRADEAAQAWLVLARDERVDEEVHASAAAALGELGRADDLLALARDEGVREDVRASAAAALGELGWADEAAPILLALARDEKVGKWVRVFAAMMLGQSADARVLPALEQIAQEDKSQDVRLAAQRAIEQIRQRTGQG